MTIADISEENGRNVSQEYEKKYSKKKIMFVKTDVTNYEDFDSKYFDSSKNLKFFSKFLKIAVLPHN